MPVRRSLMAIVMLLLASACATPNPVAGSAAPGAGDNGCAREGTAKSPGSTAAATIRFENRTQADLRVYWLDFNGARAAYGDVKAGARMAQPTWIGHLWLLADQGGTCVRVEVADAVSKEVVIGR